MPPRSADPDRPRIGLALGSGAARGWAHIGVIESLAEAGIEADIVCGSSMGALVGAAYVTGRLKDLREWAETVSWREIVSLLDIRLSGGGVVDGTLIVKFLHELGVTGPMEGLEKKYAAIATDFATGREMWLQSGPICQAVRASIAWPGVIRPFKLGNKWVLDGGVVNPVPVSVCRALGADVIIAVNLNADLLEWRLAGNRNKRRQETSKPVRGEFLSQLLAQMPDGLRPQIDVVAPKLLQREPKTPSYFEVLTTSITIMQDQITRARLAGEPPHVMLSPRLGHIGLLEFNRAREAIAVGRSCAEQALPALEPYL